MNPVGPRRAMVLAAGLGQRMRPITASRPKPLVEVMGKPLIDHVLDRLLAAGVETVVVNVHYLADQLEAHLRERRQPRIVISDERASILGTGGGIAHALPHLGREPFLVLNADSFWVEGSAPNLARLADRFDRERMDGLLLLAPLEASVGYAGRGDFSMHEDGRLQRGHDGEPLPFVYAGTALLSPGLFEAAPEPPFSLNRLFDRALAAGRLHGLALHGTWMHVGTPDAIGAAESTLAAGAA